MSSKDFIYQTLALAKKGKGKVAPNPMVGCVITKKGKIIGEGWHKKYGKDHAEVNAIKDCQAKYGEDKSKELLKDSCFFINLARFIKKHESLSSSFDLSSPYFAWQSLIAFTSA